MSMGITHLSRDVYCVLVHIILRNRKPDWQLPHFHVISLGVYTSVRAPMCTSLSDMKDYPQILMTIDYFNNDLITVPENTTIREDIPEQ